MATIDHGGESVTQTDRFAVLRDAVVSRVLDGPGATEPVLRKAAAAASQVRADLEILVRMIHRHAYRVTDEDIAALQGTYNDDELFEVIVSSAVGAALERLNIGLRAIEEVR